MALVSLQSQRAKVLVVVCRGPVGPAQGGNGPGIYDGLEAGE